MAIANLFPKLTSVPGSLGSHSGATGSPISTGIDTGDFNPPARITSPLPLLGMGALLVVAAMILKGRK